jgi:hypothetical protein
MRQGLPQNVFGLRLAALTIGLPQFLQNFFDTSLRWQNDLTVFSDKPVLPAICRYVLPCKRRFCIASFCSLFMLDSFRSIDI